MDAKRSSFSQQALGLSNQFETLVTDLSAIFTDAPAGAVEEEIPVALEEIGAFLHADGCFLGEMPGLETGRSPHWCWGSGGLGRGVLPDLLHAQHSWLASRMAAREPLVLSTPPELPERFRRAGLESAVIVPVSVGGEVTAWFGLATTRQRTWPKSLLRRLRHLGEILANALYRRRLEDRPTYSTAPPAAPPWSPRSGPFAPRVSAPSAPASRALPTEDPPTVLVLGGTPDTRELISRALQGQLAGRPVPLELPGASSSGPATAEPGETPSDTLESMERAHIVRVLEACRWRINGKGNAAERLALPPSTLRFRMKRLGIRRPEKS